LENLRYDFVHSPGPARGISDKVAMKRDVDAGNWVGTEAPSTDLPNLCESKSRSEFQTAGSPSSAFLHHKCNFARKPLQTKGTAKQTAKNGAEMVPKIV
jgi:hypothetical protein